MPSVSVEFDKARFETIKIMLRRVKGGVGAALAGAVNDTAKQVRTRMSALIRDRVNIKKKDIDPNIRIQPRATSARPAAGIYLSKTHRLSLRYFGLKQTQIGVTYKIDKNGPKKLVAHAFMGPRPGAIAIKLGGNAWIRTGRGTVRKMTKGRYKGEYKEPIRKVGQGPSPWGVFVKSGMLMPLAEETKALLQKNLEQRTRYLLLKNSGQI